ncbi:MAG: O-acetylhomoserine aminocarboxypropyltransferase/cysteine synthase [Bacteroidales bacterium]|nr:O-acetylhomoserine aminocarboxypropyltransferase/cysteine synthase [Bacteroidales bacterium]MCB9012459.1 O-acetylhomoserine aminocarboxypropyltransferase/cysteine synthase [Bacteroidales bacterium]
MKKPAGYTTRSLNTPFPKKDPHNSLHFPIYENVAYEFDSSEDIADAFQDRKKAHAYSRVTNPTVEYLEEKIKYITGAHAAIAMSSGMSAITSVMMSLTNPGDNIVSSPRLFAHSYGLFKESMAKIGVETRFVNMLDEKEIESAIDDKTRAVFFETVTNPQLEIASIRSVKAIAEKHGVLLVVDSTITPFNVFNSKDLGVNIEVLSSTKFVSGGATSVGGIVIDNGISNWLNIPAMKSFGEKYRENALLARMRKEIFRTLGPTMSPHVAQMQSLGLDIMDLRVERCYQNCIKLSEYLLAQKWVKDVNYPGLKNSPFYKLAMEQFKGIPGTVLTFDLDSQESCFRFMNNLKIIRRATNLNDNKSLIIHPWSTIYADYSSEQKIGWGLRDTMMRLSVGIEDNEDLISDIEEARS